MKVLSVCMFDESGGDNSMCMFKGKYLYVSSMVKCIQREVTLSIAQRHDFVRIIYYVY
jgi:hypothetical protein